MRRLSTLATAAIVAFTVLAEATDAAGAKPAKPVTFPLDSIAGLSPEGASVSGARHRGRAAVRLVEAAPTSGREVHPLAVVDGVSLRDGTIELDVSGEPAPGAGDGARGFVGIAFRVAPDRSRFEYFYIRPTNGRARDQLRRNHATQYASHPDFPWHRLRTESPGVYESYADMEAGAWTHLKIVVSGRSASFYVNRAPQPALIVDDLKNEPAGGGIALWAGPGAICHFSNLVVTPAE